MRSIYLFGALLALFLLCSLLQAKEKAPKQIVVSKEQQRKIRELTKQFKEAEESSADGGTSGLAKIADQFHQLGLGGSKALKELVEAQIGNKTKIYIANLSGEIRKFYVHRLISLSEDKIRKVYRTRFLWRFYLGTAAGQGHFREDFLASCREVEDILLFEASEIKNKALQSRRAELIELAGYLDQCNRKLGVNIDPTAKLRSPTNIPYPFLDTPPSFVDNLEYLEKTLVLIHTVAPAGAHEQLMKNVAVAREMDVQENGFVMYGTTIRMLMGSVVWRVDPLASACARDHANDRKNGLAKGHSSTVPGKHSMGDRLRRFGAHASGEGSGGGATGEAAIVRFSYGGGHTKPLYAIVRNVISVGRRGKATIMLASTNKNAYHHCAILDKQHFMPPGLTRNDLPSSGLKSLHAQLAGENFDGALKRINGVLEKQKSLIQKEGTAARKSTASAYELMLYRFLKIGIECEMDWLFEEIKMIHAAGDVFGAKLRADYGYRKFNDNDYFVNQIEPITETFSDPNVREELKAGMAFYKLILGRADHAAWKKFMSAYKGTVYAKAADHRLNKDPKGHPLAYFVSVKDAKLNRFGYLDALKNYFPFRQKKGAGAIKLGLNFAGMPAGVKKAYALIEGKRLFNKAYKLLAPLQSSENKKEARAAKKLRAHIHSKLKDVLAEMKALEAEGDIYRLRSKLSELKKSWMGLSPFDKAHERYALAFKKEPFKTHLKVGKEYYKLAGSVNRKISKSTSKKIERFIAKYGDSPYEKKAKKLLQDVNARLSR